jgi:CheY-like chemotaxis protein
VVSAPRVVVLAQDLVWQERLARTLEGVGASVTRAKTAPELDKALVGSDALVMDLTARAYDPFAAIQRAREAGARLLAVWQH